MLVKKEVSKLVQVYWDVTISFTANVTQYPALNAVFQNNKLVKIRSICVGNDYPVTLTFVLYFLDPNGNLLQPNNFKPVAGIGQDSPNVCLQTGQQIFFENFYVGGVQFYSIASPVSIPINTIYPVITLEIIEEMFVEEF